MGTRVQISSSVLVFCLLVVILVLIGLALCGALLDPPNRTIQVILSQFSLSSERTPPAFFAFLLLLICGVWLGIIALHEHHGGSRWWRHWAVLAVMFVFMAYDEAAGLHEKAIEPLRELLDAGGFFYYAWVIPGIIVVTITFLAYLPFLLHLPPVFRWLFLLSGAIYVGGAIGMEMISGAHIDQHGRDLVYRLMTIVEEAFEMLGALLFIASLMKYLTRRDGYFELKLGLTNRLPVGVAARAPGLGAGGAPPEAVTVLRRTSEAAARLAHPPSRAL